MNIKNLLRNPRLILERRGEIVPRIVGAVQRTGYQFGIVADANGQALRALKDKHRGRRAFILGNGPSLKVSDLALLKNEITFASNKIYLAFGDTDWRPTYYSVCDQLVAINNREVIRALPLQKFFSHHMKAYFPEAEGVHWIHEPPDNLRVMDFLDGKRGKVEGLFSTDLLAGAHLGWTVIYQQLQLAFYMGVTEVILLGLDFNFVVPEKRIDTKVRGYGVQLESTGEVNHFHPDYRKPGESWGVPRLDCHKFMFEVALRHFEAAGRKITNASRTTKLDVFPLGALDDILAAPSDGPAKS